MAPDILRRWPPCPAFVVQVHDATALHFDFRPAGRRDPALVGGAQGDRRSTPPWSGDWPVPVEDHDLAAGEFEGVHEGQFARQWRGDHLGRGDRRDGPGRARATCPSFLHGRKLSGGFRADQDRRAALDPGQGA